ncbi:hypothetical protein V565_032220 [Rhizoctonia solani 123E]|uniref:F-box-like domain protein n=1 Tax=Rhizoctonia solani 123E TaxID=1423351 RepID=A0A074STX5_9AGAM|nr:hypothetical protein V565_032220 [Rhizoctonia solani 123E]
MNEFGGRADFFILPELLHEVFKVIKSRYRLSYLTRPLQHVERKAHLAYCCLVNKTCYSYARIYLYEWIQVYTWHTGAKQRVWMILETLANTPHLASHVKALELRDFPTHVSFDERHRMIALATRAVSNCINVRSCAWTRDGTLSTRVLQGLAGLDSLKELEINAKPGAFGAWVPEDLLAFRGLQSLTLIMPARSVVELLPEWSAKNKDTLESLVVICKSTPYLNDDILRGMLPSLWNLRRLHLAGCIKLTESSVGNFLADNSHLRSLALEACSPRFNMNTLSSACATHKSLKWLTSISLTMPPSKESSERRRWLGDVILLLKYSPLESFQLYASGGTDELISYEGVNHEAIKELVDLHAATLRRIGIQRLIVPVKSLAYACEKCSQLEEIFATLCGVGRDTLAQALVTGKHLRNVHLTLMTDVAGEMRPLHLLTAQEICQHVARSCGDALQLIGSQTRVWQVKRSFSAGQTIRTLGKYTGQQIPEQFLMMRA